jgi:chromate transporter
VLAFYGTGVLQFLVLAGGGIAGSILCRNLKQAGIDLPAGPRHRSAWIALAAFCFLLIALPIAGGFAPHGPMALANVFYRAGACVFGGGHVVLPLLQGALVRGQWISDEGFLAGYGFAQAMPGPLFTVAAYLGAAGAPTHASLAWAALALAAIFLPGLLLSIVGLSLWSQLARMPTALATLAGINAAVVGLLGAALYKPIGITAIHGALDVGIAVVGLALLQWRRVSPILVAALMVAACLAVPPA